MTTDSTSAVISVRREGWELLAASFVVLFQELALIRWLPVEVRVAAYFPNLILIGAFLGLGIGALRAGHGSLDGVPAPVPVLVPGGVSSLVSGAVSGLRGRPFGGGVPVDAEEVGGVGLMPIAGLDRKWVWMRD